MTRGDSTSTRTPDEHAVQAFAERAERAQRPAGGPDGDDLVVGPVALAKLTLDGLPLAEVVVDDEQDWSIWRGRHPRLG
jgi:hypothetical protein